MMQYFAERKNIHRGCTQLSLGNLLCSETVILSTLTKQAEKSSSHFQMIATKINSFLIKRIASNHEIYKYVTCTYKNHTALSEMLLKNADFAAVDKSEKTEDD